MIWSSRGEVIIIFRLHINWENKFKKIKNIIKGIIKGCKLADCELVGGETAEMPGTYAEGKFDIAGFSVGLVERQNVN